MVSVLRQNWEFLFLLTHHQWQNCCHGNSTKGVICFFCDAHLWCQVSRTLLQYFQRYRLFSIFHFWVANRMTSSLHNRKMSISLKRKKIFQKEKRHSSVFWEAFQISTKNFSFHRHFKAQRLSLEFASRFICLQVHTAVVSNHFYIYIYELFFIWNFVKKLWIVKPDTFSKRGSALLQ